MAAFFEYKTKKFCIHVVMIAFESIICAHDDLIQRASLSYPLYPLPQILES